MLPLKDKTVLITRSVNQATEFINKLQNLGANTVTLPLINNTAINQSELISKVKNADYDWIIFTSVNAVHFYFDSISSLTINSKIGAVGNKTADALKRLNIKIDFIPSQFTAKTLANEIPILANENILIPRSNLAKNDVVEILEDRNCKVEPISIYKNSSITYPTNELNELFNQQIDFITFTSGSTITSFMKLGITLTNEKVICIGPETAKVAKENNLSVAAIATPHNIEGMIDSIISLN